MSTEQTFDIVSNPGSKWENRATVTVWHDGEDREPDSRIDRPEFRQRYGYKIVANGWEFVGNDIRSGCDAAVDVPDAARSLFSFLSACAESRAYRDRGHGPGENVDLFPEHVGEWAESVSDELGMLSIDPAEFDGEN